MKIAEPLGVIAAGNPYYKPNLNCHFQDPAILKDKECDYYQPPPC